MAKRPQQPAQLVVPLQVSKPGSQLIGSSNSQGLAAYTAGNSYYRTQNTKRTKNVLTAEATAAVFTIAIANWLRAEAEYANTRARYQGTFVSYDISNTIAQNYDYVGADPTTGRLVVLADPTIVNGGNLLTTVDSGKILYSNGAILKTDNYVQYGIVNSYNSAVPVGTAVIVAVGDDGIPLVSTPKLDMTPQQLVAETALANASLNNTQSPDNTTETNRDYISGETPQVTQGKGTVPLDPNAVQKQDPEVLASAAAAASKSTAWKEDAGSTTSPAAIDEAAASNQQDAANKAASDPVTGAALTNKVAASPTAPGTAAVSQAAKLVSSGGVGASSNSTQVERPNPLHNYATYTYKISLYAMSKNAANSVSAGQISPGGEDAVLNGASLILSSGSSKSADKGSQFKEDFFIDNLVMKSIVGTSGRTRSTDVIEINFDIIEPYNVTLLPRLIKTAAEQTGVDDWAMCFYIFRIQFLGYDDTGQPVNIPNTTKYIPFNFTSMEFDITSKGSVYRCKGIPSNQWAQTHLDNAIPFHMEFSGGTVNEIFNGNKVTTSSKPAARAPAAATTATSSQTTIKKGVSIALNDNEIYLRDKAKAQLQANTYNFYFDPAIGGKSLTDPSSLSEAYRMSDPKNNKAEKDKRTITIDKSKNTFRVQAGTKITDLINSIVQVSTYMSDQYAATTPKDKPLYTIKIVPSVEFGDYDNTTNMWQRKITYNVVPYQMNGYDQEKFGQQPPQQAVKRYNWIFTGKNKDVLDVKFNYKAAFFNIRNGGDKNAAEEGGSAAKTDPDPAEKLPGGAFRPRARPTMGVAPMSNTGPRNLNKKTVAVEELFFKQFDSIPDNMKLDLTIVGDPDLIQQDNMIYGANAGTEPVYSNGSVNFVQKEAYFYFQFNTPMKDYDDATGLFDINNEAVEHFNGYYKINAVTSEFRGGKFTQKLENYRVKVQSNSTTPARGAGAPDANGLLTG